MSSKTIQTIKQIIGDDQEYRHFIRRIKKELKGDDEELVVFFVEDGSKQVGFCALGCSPAKMKFWEKTFKEEGWVKDDFKINPDQALELMYIYLKPEYRNKGYGDRLFAQIVAFCQERGVKELYTYVSDKHDWALKFYQKKKAKVIEDFSDEGSFTAFLRWDLT